MTCKVCGHELRDDDQICEQCGHIVSEMESSAITEEERKALFGRKKKKNKKGSKSKKKIKFTKKQFMIFGGVFLGLMIVIGILGFMNRPSSDIDMNKAPYFYELDGDMYVLYNGHKEGMKLVEDYRDEFCEFVMINEEKFIVLEDKTLFIQKGKKKRQLIMENVVYFKATPSGDKMMIIDGEEQVYYYDEGKVTQLIEHQTNRDFVYSYNEEQVGFSSFIDNKKVFYIYDGSSLQTMTLDKNFVFDSFVALGDKQQYLSAKNSDGKHVLVKVKKKVTELFEFEQIFWDEGYKQALVLFGNDIYYFNGKHTEKVLNNIHSILDYNQKEKKLLFLEDGQLHVYKMGAKAAMTIVPDLKINSQVTYRVTKDYKKALLSNNNKLFVAILKGNDYEVKEYDVKNIGYISMTKDSKSALLLTDDGNLKVYSNSDEIIDVAAEVKVTKDTPRISDDGKKYIYFSQGNDLFLSYHNGKAITIGEKVKNYFIQGMNYLYYTDLQGDVYRYKVGKKQSKKLDFTFDSFYTSEQFIVQP